MSIIDTAILLAAGEGSRLRPVEPYKPLCPIGGRPLIDHALEGLAAAGIARAVVVTGYGAEAIEAHVAARAWPLAVEAVRNPGWAAPNGGSVLAGAARVGDAPCLLAMCDHLVNPALYRRVAESGPGEGLVLGVDRHLGQPFVDLDDVTRVATRGDRIDAIGKGIGTYDAYDTGVFAIGPAFVATLASLHRPSISDGVTGLAARGLARVLDCSGLVWIDVDDAAALAKAERWLATETAGAGAGA